MLQITAARWTRRFDPNPQARASRTREIPVHAIWALTKRLRYVKARMQAKKVAPAIATSRKLIGRDKYSNNNHHRNKAGASISKRGKIPVF
jgi:hypothetical protein